MGQTVASRPSQGIEVQVQTQYAVSRAGTKIRERSHLMRCREPFGQQPPAAVTHLDPCNLLRQSMSVDSQRTVEKAAVSR